MSDQSALAVVADNQHLSLALGGLHQQIFTAAEENLRATLGDDWEAYTALQRNSMVHAEALRLTGSLGLSEILMRGQIIREIEMQGLANVHPNGYANLTALAAENGVSVGELSDIRSLCDVIFPYVTDTLGLSLPELWDQVGKSKLREMVPALVSIITGNQADHNSVRQAVEAMLNEAAVNLATVTSEQTGENIEPSDVPEAQVRRQAVLALLNEGAVRTVREMRQRVRPAAVPHASMVTLDMGGQWYSVIRIETAEQYERIMRILDAYVDNQALDGQHLSEQRRGFLSGFFGGER